VSYSREDSGFVLRLVQDLKSAGAKVWLDQLDIQAGRNWDTSVHAALDRCSWVLAVLSPAFVRSKSAQDEVGLALDENKTVIPIFYQNCIVPWRLRRLQHVDFRSDYEPALGRLLTALRAKQKSAKPGATKKQPGRSVPGRGQSPVERKRLEQLKEVVSEQDRATDVEPSPEPTDEFSRAERAGQFILGRTQLRPRVGLVLGSGLGDFARELQDAVHIPFAEIPFFPTSTAIGHAGALVIGTFDGMPIAVMQGRVHLYEGYSFQQVAFPVRVLAWMGVNALVVTNAAGGINAEYKCGALVVLRDHINLQGGSPLIGPNDDRFGPRFPDMTDAYNATFRRFVLDEAERLDGGIHEGVYAALHGPSFETPAEIRALRTVGADLVGMSTVPEVIVARHMGLEVLAISCVTNMAAGMTGEKLSHTEVMETGQRIRGTFLALLRAVVPKIAGYLEERAAAG
jgi:purine-nucleoside phosphorylase